MWRVAVAVAGVLVATAPNVGSAAAPASATYVVTARRSASVDVVLGRGVEIHLGRTRVSGSGAYAGYFVQPLDRRGDFGLGELRMAEYRFPSFAQVTLPLGNDMIRGYGDPVARRTARRALPAGRYRLHVIGDATTRVTLALTGVPLARRLTASRPSPLALAWADVTPAAVAGAARPPVVVSDLPITVASSRSLTFLSMYVVRHAVLREALAAVSSYCLGPPVAARACQAGDDGDGPGPPHGSMYTAGTARLAQPPNPSSAAEGTAAYYGYDDAPAGERLAHFEVVTPATFDKVVVLAFSLAY